MEHFSNIAWLTDEAMPSPGYFLLLKLQLLRKYQDENSVNTLGLFIPTAGSDAACASNPAVNTAAIDDKHITSRLLRPKLEVIKEEMQNKGMEPAAVADGQRRMQELMREYGVTPFTPLKGLLIQGPIFISFFMAIRNMVDTVPSLKMGGPFWFTDLTTPDDMYILPVLTALTFWITVELNAQEGLEGNPAGKTIKNVSRGFAALTVPLTASFPKAIFCYWITSNLFSLSYGLVIKSHAVKKALGIPIIRYSPTTSTEQKPALPFFETLKKYAAAQQHIAAKQSAASQQPALSSPPVEESRPTSQRISASSVLSQRVKSLEKEVKGRKKNKKR
ncbi:hypothetical protein KY290_035478 [Solanum tuberosum]|uniref:Membrane insertase YidC/Oxa/ALB C-terminal domain-containing protein n=1 Tax=Solanum tuberosum TaxID=4113 RepID=A0ABQ7U692_SOLTU|nr:hypothetical protein KY289_034265 [Solanum tuberosum]KAH0646874.1 hypothetical protein KY284_034758 [Solanum tuberosum]KAH0742435.1 hypothetical protein KY290_035478 [Solanum tuberosum]